LATYLIERYEAKLVIVGRRAFEYLLPEDKAELSALQALGRDYKTEVVYLGIQAWSAAAALQIITYGGHKPISGVFNLSGVFELGAVLERKDADRQLLREKCVWLEKLLEAISLASPSSVFINFASITGTWGGAHAGGYGMLSAVTLALCVSHPTVNARTTQWTGWRGTGILEGNEHLMEAAEARGFDAVLPDQAFTALEQFLSSDLKIVQVGLNPTNQKIFHYFLLPPVKIARTVMDETFPLTRRAIAPII
jgi:KR domain